jgi:hypothetical protein
MNSDKNYWEYAHDYHEFKEELDYAYFEEDTWDRWKFFLPVTIILFWIVGLVAWNWWTTPPVLHPPGILWAQQTAWSVPIRVDRSNSTNARDLVFIRPPALPKISESHIILRR